MPARPLLPFLAAIAVVAVAAAPAAAAQAPAPSGDWRVVVTDVEDDVGRIIGFADAGTISRSGNRVGFWLEYRLERVPSGSDGFRGYVSADCAGRTYSSRDVVELAGSRVVSTSPEPEPVQPVGDGTNIAVALDNVCAGRFLSGRLDPVAHARAQFGR